MGWYKVQAWAFFDFNISNVFLQHICLSSSLCQASIYCAYSKYVSQLNFPLQLLTWFRTCQLLRHPSWFFLSALPSMSPGSASSSLSPSSFCTWVTDSGNSSAPSKPWATLTCSPTTMQCWSWSAIWGHSFIYMVYTVISHICRFQDAGFPPSFSLERPLFTSWPVWSATWQSFTRSYTWG